MEATQPESQSIYNVKEVINPDTDLLQSLLCFKCKNIVSEPQQCQGCQQIACKCCLSDTALVNSEIYCENCQSFKKFVNASKFMKKYLRTLQFSCVNKNKGCEDIIPYEELKTHKCKITCNRCQLAFIHEEHDCFERVREELLRLRKLKDIKEGTQSQEEKKGDKNCLTIKGEYLDTFQKTHIVVARTPLKCKNGHLLVLAKRKFERTTCSFCKTVFPKRQHFWSCQKCVFDLCLDCEKPKVLPWEMVSDYETFMENVRKKNYYLVSSAGQCEKCKTDLKLMLRGYKEEDRKSKCGDCQSIKKGYFWHCEMCKANFICLSCSPFSVFLHLDSQQVQP